MTSTSGKCGCGSDSKKDKPCPPSSGEKKSRMSKTPCKASGGKGKCHESHEQFKKKHTDSCTSAEDKCSSRYKEFGKGVVGDSPCGRSSQSECHSSVKEFHDSKLEDCSKQEPHCKESPLLKSIPCSAQKKQDPCPDSMDKTPNCFSEIQETKRDCRSNTTQAPYSSSVNLASEKKETPCASKDTSMYSKITSRCKNLAKDFVRPKTKSKCSAIDESQKGSICDKTAPPSSSPCPPKTEKGAGSVAPCCTSKVSCPDIKAPSWADFFPLDARNQQLNACIDKYSKIDPGQVISQCSRFANKPMDTSERCKQQQMQRMQQGCSTRQPGGRRSEPLGKSVALISPRSRVLFNRWAPSAAMYLATSALVALYVTEWKAVPIFPDEADKEAKTE